MRAGRKRRLHVAPRAPPPPTPAWAREEDYFICPRSWRGPQNMPGGGGGTSHGAKLPAMLSGDPARLGAGSLLPRPCTPAGPPLLQALPSSLPPSSPSLNSPTASIDVLPASPSPAQPDSTWERQVKAAGPWEGSSCAPRQRGRAGRGRAGSGHPAEPPTQTGPGSWCRREGFPGSPRRESAQAGGR